MSKLPKILYKYRDWSNPSHRKVLENSELYLSEYMSFDDPYDTYALFRFPEGDELYSYILKKDKSFFIGTGLEFLSRRQRAEFIIRTHTYTPEAARENWEYFREKVNDTTGILCLSSHAYNDEMWNKYANNHTGVCFGFNPYYLFEAVKYYEPELWKIKYVDELPIVDFAKDNMQTKGRKLFYTKLKEWSFEKEWRFSITTHLLQLHPQLRILHFSPECLVSIRLGKNMSEADKKEIKDIASKRFPNAQIIEMK